MNCKVELRTMLRRIRSELDIVSDDVARFEDGVRTIINGDLIRENAETRRKLQSIDIASQSLEAICSCLMNLEIQNLASQRVSTSEVVVGVKLHAVAQRLSGHCIGPISKDATPDIF